MSSLYDADFDSAFDLDYDCDLDVPNCTCATCIGIETASDHATENCWMAGEEGHFKCTLPKSLPNSSRRFKEY